MSASITTPPPAKSLSNDRIWVVQSTNNISGGKSFVRFRSTGNNNAGETISITFGATTLTFTLAAAPDNSGLQLPVRSGETNEEYAEMLAEGFRENQILTDDFVVFTSEIGAGIFWVTIQSKTAIALNMTMTETVTNLEYEQFSSSGPYLEENLRAVIEVWTDTGSFNTEASLGQQHAIYDATRGTAEFDLSSHFVHLKPHLPSTLSIPSGVPLLLRYGKASDAFQKWYFRYADKYGSPAVAESMQRYSGSYITLHGSHGGEALTPAVFQNPCHNRKRRDGQLFWKPVGLDQVDYIYFIADASSLALNHAITLYWSDGTVESYSPGLTVSGTMDAGDLYWVGVGYKQLKLDQATPPSDGALIVRYEFTYQTPDPVTIWTARFEVLHDCQGWGFFLLYANGLGGCETVFLRGIGAEKYTTTQEIVQRIRQRSWTLSDGELDAHAQQGFVSWEANTGWYDDPYYLDHLRQLPLADKAWLVDLDNRRFIPVIVESGEIQTRQNDADRFALDLTIRAAWVDQNVNI